MAGSLTEKLSCDFHSITIFLFSVLSDCGSSGSEPKSTQSRFAILALVFILQELNKGSSEIRMREESGKVCGELMCKLIYE